jgi:hypothetical protein
MLLSKSRREKMSNNQLQEGKRELFSTKREPFFKEGIYNINIYRLKVPLVPSIPSIFSRVEAFSSSFFSYKKKGEWAYSRNVLFLEGTEGTLGTFAFTDSDHQKIEVPSWGKKVPSTSVVSDFLCVRAYRFYKRFPLCQMIAVFREEVVNR